MNFIPGKAALFLLFMHACSLQAQNRLKITDQDGRGISQCQVLSSKNHVMLVSDDSGLVNMDPVKLADTLLLMHLEYRTKYFEYRPSRFQTALLKSRDTTYFRAVSVRPCRSGKTYTSESYGNLVKKKTTFDFKRMALGCTKVVKRLGVKNVCAQITRINLFVVVPKQSRLRDPFYNKNLAKKYKLVIFIVKDTTINDDSSVRIPIYLVENVSRLKNGWNSFNIDSCFLGTKNFMIGFSLVLKTGESDQPVDIFRDNYFLYQTPLYLGFSKSDSVNFYNQEMCYGRQSSWFKDRGDLILNIETREY